MMFSNCIRIFFQIKQVYTKYYTCAVRDVLWAKKHFYNIQHYSKTLLGKV